MTMIPARKPYTPVALGASYSPAEIRQALALVSQSVPPMTTRTVLAATTLQTTDDLLVCDTTAGSFAVLLPVVSTVQFLRATIINIGANTVTVTGTVSSAVNPTLAQWKSITVQSDGVRWLKIAGV